MQDCYEAFQRFGWNLDPEYAHKHQLAYSFETPDTLLEKRRAFGRRRLMTNNEWVQLYCSTLDEELIEAWRSVHKASSTRRLSGLEQQKALLVLNKFLQEPNERDSTRRSLFEILERSNSRALESRMKQLLLARKSGKFGVKGGVADYQSIQYPPPPPPPSMKELLKKNPPKPAQALLQTLDSVKTIPRLQTASASKSTVEQSLPAKLGALFAVLV